MKKTPYRLATITSIVGLMLSVPLAASAADKAKDMPKDSATTVTHPAYSDRANMKSMTEERDALERDLKTGQKAEAYMTQLKKMGYQITAINDQKPDYVEFEIVKGHNSHEVQIDRDKSSGLATKIDVTANMWRADSTKAALKGKTVEMMKTDKYSDRGYQKGWTDDKGALEKAMAPGQDKAFYTSKLKQLGYQITSTNEANKSEVEYEVVKGTHSYEVQLNLDDKTGKVKDVDVSSNLWQSDATERALGEHK